MLKHNKTKIKAKSQPLRILRYKQRSASRRSVPTLLAPLLLVLINLAGARLHVNTGTSLSLSSLGDRHLGLRKVVHHRCHDDDSPSLCDDDEVPDDA